MDYFDSGLFLILSTLSFIFMIISFKYIDAMAGSTFFLFAGITFMVLSLVLVSEIPIQSITSISDGTTTWTETETLISGENGYILGMFFMIFGLLNFGLMMWKMIGGKGGNDY